MYNFSISANITFQMDDPPKSREELSKLLNSLEEHFYNFYKIRKIYLKNGSSVRPFINFNHHFDFKKELCPHSLPSEKHGTLARVIYGYTDDSDEELNARDGKDLYLAGCVPDSYGVDIEGNWIYPTRYCNFCKKFSRYLPETSALSESP